MAVVILCKDCKVHPFQDALYGLNMRVHNLLKAAVPQKGRCTVCSDEKNISVGTVVVAKQEKGSKK